MKRIILASIAFALPLVSASAQDVRGFFETHNAIVFDEAKVRFEIEGRVWINGIATIEQSLNFGINTTIPKNDYSFAAGSINSGSNWVNVNQGSVLSRSSPITGNFNMNSGGSKVSGQAAWDANLASHGFNSFGEIRSGFENLSQHLSTLSTTGTFQNSDPNQFRISGDGSAFSVVNVTGAQLASAHGLELLVPGEGILLINVDGDLALKANLIGQSTANADNVIWNLYNAGSISFDRRVEGSIIAPYASATLKDGFEGLLVANALAYSGGEGHFRPLDGSALPIPEPASALLGILGFLRILFRQR